jgi:hypothetical protein
VPRAREGLLKRPVSIAKRLRNDFSLARRYKEGYLGPTLEPGEATMRARAILCIASFFTFQLALASNPGQPIDCSDWVFLEPGYSCSEISCGDQDGNGQNFCTSIYSYVIFDNEGHLLRLSKVFPFPSCPGGQPPGRTQLSRYDGVTEQVVAYLDDRCSPGNLADVYRTTDSTLFDDSTGLLYAAGASLCSNNCYPSVSRMMVISGFATTFEILQTYEPSSTAFQFRVPKRPEGLASADYFDTYVGVLAHPVDFASAQPLQCHYPASPPTVGDYFSIADTLPAPEPGQGYYYVTAVTHDGQTRYGRQTIGGVTSGRNPALLPACSR